MEHIDKSLYQLQPADINTPPPQSDKIMKSCMKQIDSFHDKLSEDAEHKIKQVIKMHNTVFKCFLDKCNSCSMENSTLPDVDAQQAKNCKFKGRGHTCWAKTQMSHAVIVMYFTS